MIFPCFSTQYNMRRFNNIEIEELYKQAFPPVARLIKNYGGNLDKARDIFHDALIIYLEKRAACGFVPEKEPVAYIMGIARILMIRASKAEHVLKNLDQEHMIMEVPEDFYPQWTNNEQTILGFLQRAGKKCVQLLQAFYYENMNMKELAGRFGFTTVRSATVQKFKCMEKLREHVKKEEVYEEVFN